MTAPLFREQYVFICVGVFNTALYVVLYWILLCAKLGAIFSGIFAYITCLSASYLLHATFTFSSANKEKSPMRFILVNVFMVIAVSLINGSHYVQESPFVGALLVGLLIPVLNYCVYKFWVFAMEK